VETVIDGRAEISAERDVAKEVIYRILITV
jgi:hypothetical protein